MKLLPLLLLLTSLARSAPDCQYKYRFTNRAGEPTDGVFVMSGATNAPTINNTEQGCVGWSLMMSSEGFSVISLNLQTAPRTYQGSVGASTPGSWSTFSGTDVLGSLPITSTTAYAYIGYAFFPYVRVNLATATGTGSVEVVLNGWKSTTYLTGGSGGGGGGAPSGPAGGMLAGTYPNPTLNTTQTGNITWNGNQVYSGNVDLTASTLTTPSVIVRTDTNATTTAGKGVTFVPSASLYSLILSACGTVPTTITAGGVCIDSTGEQYWQDGTNVRYHPYVVGSGNTPPSAPTSGQFVKWGSSFSQTGSALATSDIPATLFATGTSVTLTAPREYYICTGTCTVTPPVPAAGYEFCVLNDDNIATVITMAAIGSSARYETTARTSYGTAGTGTFVSGGAVGDKICLLGRDSTHYLTVSFTGTWTAN